jgi:hypothetical protein
MPPPPLGGCAPAHGMRQPGSQNPSPQSNLGLNRGPNGLPESRPERRVPPGRPGNQGFTQSCTGTDPLTNPGDNLPFSVKGSAHGKAALVSESLVVERSTAAAPGRRPSQGEGMACGRPWRLPIPRTFPKPMAWPIGVTGSGWAWWMKWWCRSSATILNAWPGNWPSPACRPHDASCRCASASWQDSRASRKKQPSCSKKLP